MHVLVGFGGGRQPESENARVAPLSNLISSEFSNKITDSELQDRNLGKLALLKV